MWLIVSGDGDLDYTRVFGPFDSEEDATAALPEDDDDIRWRVTNLESPDRIVHEPEVVDDAPVAVQPATPAQFNYSRTLDTLVDQYGALENIPAPNADVYAFANAQIHQLKQTIASVINHGPSGPALPAYQVQLIFFEEVARIHRPRAGF